MAAHIDGAHRLHQFFRPAAFGQIAAGAGIQRALHEGRGVIDTEDDRAELRLLRSQAFQQAQAVFIRHGDVHHRDADVVAQQCRPGCRRAAVLPHHVEIVFEAEQLRKAGAHHHMVIHQYHTDHFRTLLPNHDPMMPAAAVLAISQARLCNRCNRIVIKGRCRRRQRSKSMAKCCHSAARRSSSECSVVSWRW